MHGARFTDSSRGSQVRPADASRHFCEGALKQSMGHDVRFIVLNGEEHFAGELRALLLGISGVKIVAEVDEPALLAQAIQQFPADVALVNLDPTPDGILPVMAEAIKVSPDLTFFAVSASTDGQLILKTIRTGVREFLPKPIEQSALEEAVHKVATQCANNAELGTLITVLGASGGVGATMFAANLAVELATIVPGRVTIVDLDYRFGQVATLLDVEPRYTLADLCSTPEELDPQIIDRAVVRHGSGLYVLSRPASIAQADTITGASCVSLLSKLLQFNDYVVVDGPTRSDLNARPVLDLSDVNVLLLELVVPTVRNAARMIAELREGGYNTHRTRLICNRIGRDAGSLSVADVSETLDLPMFATIPDDWPTVSAAINLGLTLQSHSPKSRVRQAVEEIARRLHSPDSQSDDKDTQKKGLIGRIFAAG